MKPSMRWSACILVAAGSVALASRANARVPASSRAPDEMQTLGSIRGKSLSVSINSDGSYSIALFGLPGAVLRSKVEADVNDGVLQSSAYPQRKIAQSPFHDEFGSGSKLMVTHTGLPGKPDLVCTIRLYQGQSWGDIAVEVLNTTDKAVTVQAIRSVQISDSPDINLNAPESADRVLSDSFSEDRPQLAIRDLGDAPKGMLRAVGSQLIFNRQSRESLFLGALTTNQLLTIFHLKEQGAGPNAKIVSYEVTSTGTTEIMKEESLRHSPPAEQMSLSLPVESGESLSSERLMFAIGTDYHAQLEQYGMPSNCCTRLASIRRLRSDGGAGRPIILGSTRAPRLPMHSGWLRISKKAATSIFKSTRDTNMRAANTLRPMRICSLAGWATLQIRCVATA